MASEVTRLWLKEVCLLAVEKHENLQLDSFGH